MFCVMRCKCMHLALYPHSCVAARFQAMILQQLIRHQHEGARWCHLLLLASAQSFTWLTVRVLSTRFLTAQAPEIAQLCVDFIAALMYEAVQAAKQRTCHCRVCYASAGSITFDTRGSSQVFHYFKTFAHRQTAMMGPETVVQSLTTMVYKLWPVMGIHCMNK